MKWYWIISAFVVLLYSSCSSDRELQEKYEVMEPEFSDGRKVCIEKNPYTQNTVVDSFQQEFRVELNVDVLKLGDRILRKEETYTDTIKGGSCFFGLNDTTGVAISLTRAVDQHGKKHLYKKSFYKRRKDCWVDVSGFGTWSDFVPSDSSALLTGFSTGKSGKPGYIGVEGELWIR